MPTDDPPWDLFSRPLQPIVESPALPASTPTRVGKTPYNVWDILPESIRLRAEANSKRDNEMLVVWLSRAITAQADKEERSAAQRTFNHPVVTAMALEAASAGDLLQKRRDAFHASQRPMRQLVKRGL